MGNIVIVGANQGIGYYMAQRLLELENSVAGEQNLIWEVFDAYHDTVGKADPPKAKEAGPKKALRLLSA